MSVSKYMAYVATSSHSTKHKIIIGRLMIHLGACIIFSVNKWSNILLENSLSCL